MWIIKTFLLILRIFFFLRFEKKGLPAKTWASLCRSPRRYNENVFFYSFLKWECLLFFSVTFIHILIVKVNPYTMKIYFYPKTKLINNKFQINECHLLKIKEQECRWEIVYNSMGYYHVNFLFFFSLSLSLLVTPFLILHLWTCSLNYAL